LHMVQLMPLPSQNPPSSLDSFKCRLALPFWYQLTQVVLEKMPLNGSSSSSVFHMEPSILTQDSVTFRSSLHILPMLAYPSFFVVQHIIRPMKFVKSAQFRVCCKCFSFCGTWSVGRARKPHWAGRGNTPILHVGRARKPHWAGRGNTPILQTLLFCPQLHTAVAAQGQIQELALVGGGLHIRSRVHVPHKSTRGSGERCKLPQRGPACTP